MFSFQVKDYGALTHFTLFVEPCNTNTIAGIEVLHKAYWTTYVSVNALHDFAYPANANHISDKFFRNYLCLFEMSFSQMHNNQINTVFKLIVISKG